MQILSIHNKYIIRGGEDESRELEQQLLKEEGHLVDIYEENNDRISSLTPTNLALRTIWSSESYQSVKHQLQLKKYDLVHIQNFFPLISPSVYYSAKSEGIPVVQTLRNYRLLCPNALFFREGKVCEDCLGKFIPYPAILHRCYRENRAASSVTAAMLTSHRMLGTWTKMVDMYITLSNFAREKFIQAGFPENKIVVKPNFVHPDPGCGEGLGNYGLFVGRLSVEKGLDTLLEAWSILKNPPPLKIVGDGPLSEEVNRAAEKNSKIKWLGRQPMSEVHQLMGNAHFVVFPSNWYETFGRVAIEAFAKGTPVIAANIGALAELISHEETGLLFEAGNSQDLANQIDFYLSNPAKVGKMRENARKEFELKFTAEVNYQMIREIYHSVL